MRIASTNQGADPVQMIHQGFVWEADFSAPCPSRQEALAHLDALNWMAVSSYWGKAAYAAYACRDYRTVIANCEAAEESVERFR